MRNPSLWIQNPPFLMENSLILMQIATRRRSPCSRTRTSRRRTCKHSRDLSIAGMYIQADRKRSINRWHVYTADYVRDWLEGLRGHKPRRCGEIVPVIVRHSDPTEEHGHDPWHLQHLREQIRAVPAIIREIYQSPACIHKADSI